MDLAEKVALDFQRDSAPMLKTIQENVDHHKSQIHDLQRKGTALQTLTGLLHLWIPRMEGLGHPKNAQTAREMRDGLKDLEKILYG